jgi:hypothetical protein
MRSCAGGLLICVGLVACGANTPPVDGGIDRPIDRSSDQAPEVGGAGDVGASDAMDAPFEHEPSDASDGPTPDGGAPDGVCATVAPDGRICDPVTDLVWVATDVPITSGGRTYVDLASTTDLLGKVTSIGVFTRKPTGELVLRTNAGDLVVTTPSPFDGDIRASSTDDIWVVPTATNVSTTFYVGVLRTSQFAHWDGATWTVVIAPAAINGHLTAFWIDARGIWVAAATPVSTFVYQAVLYRWSDGAWSVVPSPVDDLQNARVTAIWGSAPDDVWAGGKVTTGSGSDAPVTALVMHWNGTTWSTVAPPVLNKSPQMVFNIWGSSSNDIWFAGEELAGGNIWHFDGSSWTDADILSGSTPMFGLWGTGPADVWASVIGSSGGYFALVWHFDGKAWSNYEPVIWMTDAQGRPKGPVGLAQVKGSRAGDLWAAATSELVFGQTISAYAITPQTSSEVQATAFHLQPNACGDGTIGACEACDPPARPSTGDQCGCDCRYLRCGNGLVDPGEECDPPSIQRRCDATCHFMTCGNRQVDVGEECDPPNVGRGSDNTCDPNCKSIPIACGNGYKQPGEGCDIPDGIFCVGCRRTDCEIRLTSWGASRGISVLTTVNDLVCSSLSGAAAVKCGALLNCIAISRPPNTPLYGCVSRLDCYCSGFPSGCPLGADGPCAAEFEAVAGSTDVAEVLRQLHDPTTTVNQLLTEAGWINARAASEGAVYCQ